MFYSNIVLVALSFYFDIVIYLLYYLCLNVLYLILGLFLVSLRRLYIELRMRAYYSKIFFNIQLFYLKSLIYICTIKMKQ